MVDATISIGIDSKPADQGAKKITRSLDDVKKRVKQTTKEMDGLKGGLGRVAKGIRLVDGPLGGIASRFQTLNSILKDNVAGIVALTIAFAGFGFALKKSIGLTIEQERVVAQLNATITSTGMAAGLTSIEVQKMASSFQSVTKFGDEAIIAGQNILLTFTKIGKDTFPLATEAVLNMSTALGIDLKSAAIQVGKALNDPIKGLTALTRSGIQFEEEQQDLIKLLTLTGRTAQAQALILKELDTQFKDSARAARETFGGALAALSNTFGDAFEKVEEAQALVPIINSLEKNLGVLFDVMLIAGVGAITAFTLSLIPAAAATTTFAGQIVLLTTSFTGLIGRILTLLGPIGLLTVAVAGIVIHFSGLDKVMLALEATFIAFQAGIIKTANAVITIAAVIPDAFANAFKKVADLRKSFSKDLSEFFSNPFGDNKGFDNLSKEIDKGFSVGLDNALNKIKEFNKIVDEDTTDKIVNLADVIEEGMVDPTAAARIEMEKNILAAQAYAVEVGNVAAELKRVEDANKRLKEGTNEIKTIFEDIAQDLKSSFSNVFKRIFSEGRTGFKEFGEDILDIFTDSLARLATMAIANPIIIPVLQSVGGVLGLSGGDISGVTGQFGGGGAGGLGDIGSLLSAGKSVLGGGSLLFNQGAASAFESIGQFFGFGGASSVGPLGPLPVGGSPFGQAAGSAFSPASIAGGFLGNFGANAIFGGDRGIGASIGGTLGGIAGQIAIPIPVIGAAIGSFLGNALGGLFGGGKGTVASEFETTGVAGDLTSTFGSKRADTKFAEGIAGGVEALIGSLDLLGLDVGGQKIRGGLNTKQRGGGFLDIFDPEGNISKGITFDESSAESLDEALAKLTLSLAQTADTSNESLLIALQNITAEGRTAAEVIADLEFAANFENLFAETVPTFTALELQMQAIVDIFEEAAVTAERLGLSELKLTEARMRAEQVIRRDFNESIKDQILAIQAPSQLALRELERQFAVLRRNALAIGGDLVQVEELFGLKRQQILEQFQTEQLAIIEDGFQAQFDAISSTFESTVNDLVQFRNSLALSATLSGTSREGRALEADRQLDELATRIAAGDEDALDDLQGVSTRALEAALDYYGPTEQFLERLAKVDTIIESAKGVAENQFDTELAILEQNRITNTTANATLTELQKQTQILFDLAAQTSASFIASQNIGSSQITRPGETGALEGLNALTQLDKTLTRQFKVQASGGAFDFSGTQSFADFVKTELGGQAAGKEFLRLVAAAGGATAEQSDIFGFAHGTGNSRFSGMAIVGEEGPELVNFDRPAQIFSNRQSQSLSSGVEAANAINSAVNGLRQQSAKETAFLGTKFDAMIAEMGDIKDELSKRPV